MGKDIKSFFSASPANAKKLQQTKVDPKKPQPKVEPKKPQEKVDPKNQPTKAMSSPANAKLSEKLPMNIEEEAVQTTPVKVIPQNPFSTKAKAIAIAAAIVEEAVSTKSKKKQSSAIEIEKDITPVSPIHPSTKTTNTSSSKLSRNKKAVIDSDVEPEVQEEIAPQVIAPKKKKLTKLSEKTEKIVPPPPPPPKRIEPKKGYIVSSEEEESEQDESDNDSVEGEVVFVDDDDIKRHMAQPEGKRNKNKGKKAAEESSKVDTLQQKTLSFDTKKPTKKVVEAIAQSNRQSVFSNLSGFLSTQQTQAPSTSVYGLPLLSDGESDKSMNSDEEELERIRKMMNQRENGEKVSTGKSAVTSNQTNESYWNSVRMEEEKEEKKDEEKSVKIEQVTTAATAPAKVAEAKSVEEAQKLSISSKVFLINGDLNQIPRNILENILKQNQGQIRTQVHNTIDYCLRGSRNVSLDKHKWFLERKTIKIVLEDEFIDFLEDNLGICLEEILEKYSAAAKQIQPTPKPDVVVQPPKVVLPPAEQPTATKQAIREIPKKVNEGSSLNLSSWLPGAIAATTPSPLASPSAAPIEIQIESSQETVKTKSRKPAIQEIQQEPEVYSQTQTQAAPNKIREQIKTMEQTAEPKPNKIIAKQMTGSALWTHKYAPRSLSDCVGNFQQIKKIENWLRNWEDVVLRGKSAQGSWRENPGARACLISGPPGIGKTSTVRLLAEKLNMSIIEWNASDVRNRSAIDTIVNPLKDNQVINFQGEKSSQRSIVLMDEVDGMSSGDIGGSASLIKIIKETKNPIFCVCNDRFSVKLRSLASYCFDVRFHKPEKHDVAKRLEYVCQSEGITSDLRTLEVLAENANTDIRQSLNLLEMCSKKSKTIEFRQLCTDLNKIKKDDKVAMNVFEATKVLLTKNKSDKYSIEEKIDLFFLDYSLLPLLIQENYLTAMKPYTGQSSLDDLQTLVTATNVFCECDMIDKSISASGSWSLLQDKAFLSSVYTPEVLPSSLDSIPVMTQQLGKMSSQRKTMRLLKELRMQFALITSGNRASVQFDYSPPLIEMIIRELQKHTAQTPTIPKVIEFMAAYNITPEILREHLIAVQYKGDVEQRLQAIPTAVKSGLTRAYNKKFKDDVKAERKTKTTAGEQGEYARNEEGDEDFMKEDLDEEGNENDQTEVEEQKEQSSGKKPIASKQQKSSQKGRK